MWTVEGIVIRAGRTQSFNRRFAEFLRIDFNGNRGYRLVERITRREGIRQEGKIETTYIHEESGRFRGRESR